MLLSSSCCAEPTKYCTYPKRIPPYLVLPFRKSLVKCFMAFLPLSEIPVLFPHIVNWIKDLNWQARKSGKSLSGAECDLARRVGVTHLEDVRILSVGEMPLPNHPRIKQLAQQLGLLTSNTSGLTAVHGVILRLDCTNNPRLLTHEFVHVEQYERLGTKGFLREYILQLNKYGYQNAPFELEAEEKSVKACLDSGF
jgi:hypothetical protein